ncbi:MAG: type III secretion system chaperone [Desulfovibrionales bacterium]|nr:type III secretion system chaperone [Desulfovibrionales bacterium]
MSTRPMLLIKEFMTTIGMEFDEHLEKEQSILLELEGGVIFTFWARDSQIIVVSPLATVSEEDEAEVYAECLEENFAAFPEMNRFFSLDKESRELVLMASWGVAETPFESFLKDMTDFAELAQKWHAKLVHGKKPEAPKEEAVEPPSRAHDMMMHKA